ncbi:MAG: DUF1003 domain-containing protein [Aeromicrobium sp.]
MAERARLDQPRQVRRGLLSSVRRRREFDPERFGRFAETFARFLGTARFLTYMTIFVVIWLAWNSPYGPDRGRWDAYPFIFLTLILSLQASYAAPLILLAQNRQEARDRVTQEQERESNAQSHADMEFLAREVAGLRMGLGEVATRDFLRGELRGLLSDLDKSSEQEKREPEDPTRPKKPAAKKPDFKA